MANISRCLAFSAGVWGALVAMASFGILGSAVQDTFQTGDTKYAILGGMSIVLLMDFAISLLCCRF